MINDTIVAPATGLLNQAISIIRISGDDSYLIINKIFSKTISPSKSQIHFGYIKNNNEIVDEVILVCFEKPHSYTGEDTIEINCHGGVVLTNKILSLVIKNGARLAKNGEFTQRAFLNGKINLIQAEAINDLINANNDMSAKIAINNLQNKNFNVIEQFRNSLIDIITNIEVNIDYPEYDDVKDISIDELKNKIVNLKSKINNIIEMSRIRKLINNGINVLILGKPNVGKSSLLNAIVNDERAIVSNIEGTTRDIIEEKINIGDLVLNVIDTAGIHSTNNYIEKVGIKKAKSLIDIADLILLVFDSTSNFLTKEEKDLLRITKNKKRLLVINKVDLSSNYFYGFKNDDFVEVSAINCNISNLILRIKGLFYTDKLLKDDSIMLSNINQISYFERIEQCLKNAYNDIVKGFPVDIISVHLHEAWDLLKELIGEKYDDSLLNIMFSRYCLGK